MLAMKAWISLVLFMALLLALALNVLAASGHFPREHRAPTLTTGNGPLLLYGSIVVVALCLLAGVAAARWLIPWFAAVIGGGLAILGAPLMLQRFPDRFVDGRGALLVFAGAGAVLALLMVLLAASEASRP
jgi:hypothetical protein